MLLSTTHTLEGKKILAYKGLVFGEVIEGANIIRDFLANITDIIGGRSRAYETNLLQARNQAIGEMMDRAAVVRANAIIGVNVRYETVGTMFLVVASGTAVVIDDVVEDRHFFA